MKAREAALLTTLVVVAHTPLAAQSSVRPVDRSAILSQLPSRALVSGTPFVSWADAARMNYPNKDVMNPSWAASLAMVLRYWDQDLSFLGRSDQEVRTWGTFEAHRAQSLNDLKPFAAQGVPVVVDAALTAAAHPLSIVTSFMAAAKGFKLPEGGPYSGTLGRLIPLEMSERLEKELYEGKSNPLDESMLKANRVFLGYDDDRRVVILHDPSFGPAWEVGYEDFEKMWAAMGRGYLVAVPHDSAGILQRRRAAELYRARTPDEAAAAHYVLACAYSVAGRLEEARTLLEEGLNIREASSGYRHLLLAELALHLGAAHSTTMGELERAIRLAEEAVSILPEHAQPWALLAHLYSVSSFEGHEHKAQDAEKKAKKLASDRKALGKVAEIMPRDFWIRAVRSGW